MATSKDKRIKKFKRKRIWPSIVGMIIIVLIFAFMMVLMFEVSVLNIAQTKLSNAEMISKEVASLFQNYEFDEDTKTSAQELATAYVIALPEVEDIYVSNEKGEQVWSCNGQVPDKDSGLGFEIESIYEDIEYNIIIEQDEFGVFTIDKGTNRVDIADDFFEHMDFEKMFSEMQKTENMHSSVMDWSMWYVISQGDYVIYVLNYIPIYGNDLIGMVLIFALCVMLIAVFAIYYIISFIGVMLSEHRTTKIIYTDMITGGQNWFYFIKKGTAILKRNRGKKNYAVVHLCMHKYHSFCTCFGVRKGEELLTKFYQVLHKKCAVMNWFLIMKMRSLGCFWLIPRRKSW